MKSLKTLKKAAGIFAAMALVFGAVSCSSDDDDDDSTVTSLANTYWVVEDETSDSVTIKAASYIYVESDTAGTLYQINQDEIEKVTENGKGGDVSYDSATSVTFTYTFDGTTATITFADKSTVTGTVSGNTLTVKGSYTDDEGKSVDYEDIYTKGEKPTACTVTVSGSEGGGSTEKLNIDVDITSLDFSTTTSGLTNTAESGKNGTFMIPEGTEILEALSPTADNKAFWYTSKALDKISALQLNGDGKLKFTLSSSATVKVTFLSTGDSNTSSITVNEKQESVTGKTAQTFTWTISSAGDYTIASTGASNARITKISIVED